MGQGGSVCSMKDFEASSGISCGGEGLYSSFEQLNHVRMCLKVNELQK